MSAAAYEKWRERVRERGPEYIEQEQEWNEAMAQLQFALETEPGLKQALKDQIRDDMQSLGIEGLLKSIELSEEAASALESGAFDVTVKSPSESEPDQLALEPEGTVGETLALKTSVAESYLSQLQGGK